MRLLSSGFGEFETGLIIRPQLFKGCIALSIGQITMHWMTQFILIALIHWLVIYLVDSSIQHLNIWDQDQILDFDKGIERCQNKSNNDN